MYFIYFVYPEKHIAGTYVFSYFLSLSDFIRMGRVDLISQHPSEKTNKSCVNPIWENFGSLVNLLGAGKRDQDSAGLF